MTSVSLSSFIKNELRKRQSCGGRIDDFKRLESYHIPFLEVQAHSTAGCIQIHKQNSGAGVPPLNLVFRLLSNL